MTFSDLHLAEPILRALAKEKFVTPSPIQEMAIPHLLDGKDILGCAQTGTGKTAAFALPIIDALLSRPKSERRRTPTALILTPTRELAAQVGASFATFGAFTNVRTTVIYGGVSQRPQENALRRGVDVVVATPGRLRDLMNQRLCDLRDITTLVLDEADHMLDLGFIHDVKAIVAKIPKQRQTLLFSATMPKEIASLAASILTDPVTVTVAPVSSAVETVDQSVYHVEKNNKIDLLTDILDKGDARQILVFSRTKHGADKIGKRLNGSGVTTGVIHGNKSQAARRAALDSFKKGSFRVLVATDIAARGIDIKALPLVVNFDLPDVPETYVHRIGRTGRAGRNGNAISFCDSSERSLLRAIETLLARRIPAGKDHAHSIPVQRPAAQEPSRSRVRGDHAQTSPASRTRRTRRGDDKPSFGFSRGGRRNTERVRADHPMRRNAS